MGGLSQTNSSDKNFGESAITATSEPSTSEDVVAIWGQGSIGGDSLKKFGEIGKRELVNSSLSATMASQQRLRRSTVRLCRIYKN